VSFIGMRPSHLPLLVLTVCSCNALDEPGEDGRLGAWLSTSTGQYIPTTGAGGGSATTSTTDATTGSGVLRGPLIERVHGNGMLVYEGFANAEPMKVRVTNGGDPIAGTNVHWEILEPGGALNTLEGGLASDTTTDDQGYARILFRGQNLAGNIAGVVQTVRASIPEGSVEFTVTTIETGDGFPLGPAAIIIAPSNKDAGEGAAGTVLPGAVEICVYSQAGLFVNHPFENAGIRIVHADNRIDGSDPFGDLEPPVQCSATEGTVLTGADGCGVCDLGLGMAPGQHTFLVRVGGVVEHQNFTVQISP
jgi:hypothetical protein